MILSDVIFLIPEVCSGKRKGRMRKVKVEKVSFSVEMTFLVAEVDLIVEG